MASLCKRQQCTIDRRGFRQELDSWRHKLIHCVGFESILEGLFGSELVQDLQLFKDREPLAVSDWSFDENCVFCCLRRDKVKEHLSSLNSEGLEDPPKPLLVKDQTLLIKLERQAEEFLSAVLRRKDVPNFSDPHVPVVAREILQRMIRQFAAEYTSKASPQPQDRPDSQPRSDQSLPSAQPPCSSPTAASLSAAHNLNPVLSKLLMVDQDAPLDLTVKKAPAEPAEQDGVLDLSIKKNRTSSFTPNRSSCLSPVTSTPKWEPREVQISKVHTGASTLEQFMCKLCLHHQRQIVSAIRFLQVEVQALAPSKASPPIVSAHDLQRTSFSPVRPHSATPTKTQPDPPKPHSNPEVRANRSLKPSVTPQPPLDVSRTSPAPQTSVTPTAEAKNGGQVDHAPLKLKIMKTGSVSAGNKLSCVLATSLSPQSVDDRQSSSSSVESSSFKKHEPSHAFAARQSMTPPLSLHPTTPSIVPRTARKSLRPSPEHHDDDFTDRIILDPDLGHCDIVYINKPITESFKKRHRGLVPRRNARKSTRGHMYSDDVWEIKTVRTLAGRGNCPNLLLELNTSVTPKQNLSKPEGVPPVDMPCAGECREAMDQQIATLEPTESKLPETGQAIETTATDAEVVVETSQTDQSVVVEETVCPSTEKEVDDTERNVEQEVSAEVEESSEVQDIVAQVSLEGEKETPENATDTQQPETESEQPVTQETESERPVTPETVSKRSVTAESVTQQPVTVEGVSEQPVTPESVTQQPVTAETVSEQPVTTDTVTEQLGTVESVTKKPVTVESVTQQLVAPETVTEQDVIPETVSEQLVTPEAVIEQSITAETVTERPVTPETTTEKLVIPETVSLQPVTPETLSEQPVTPETVTEQPVTPETVSQSAEDRVIEQTDEQVSSDSREIVVEQTETPSEANEVSAEESAKDKMQEESQSETIETEKPTETVEESTEVQPAEVTVTKQETETDKANTSRTPESQIARNEPDLSTKTIEELANELPPWRKTKTTALFKQRYIEKTEEVVVGFVNGLPVLSSDRSLRRRSGPTLPPKELPSKRRKPPSKSDKLNTESSNSDKPVSGEQEPAAEKVDLSPSVPPLTAQEPEKVDPSPIVPPVTEQERTPEKVDPSPIVPSVAEQERTPEKVDPNPIIPSVTEQEPEPEKVDPCPSVPPLTATPEKVDPCPIVHSVTEQEAEQDKVDPSPSVPTLMATPEKVDPSPIVCPVTEQEPVSEKVDPSPIVPPVTEQEPDKVDPSPSLPPVTEQTPDNPTSSEPKITPSKSKANRRKRVDQSPPPTRQLRSSGQVPVEPPTPPPASAATATTESKLDSSIPTESTSPSTSSPALVQESLQTAEIAIPPETSKASTTDQQITEPTEPSDSHPQSKEDSPVQSKPNRRSSRFVPEKSKAEKADGGQVTRPESPVKSEPQSPPMSLRSKRTLRSEPEPSKTPAPQKPLVESQVESSSAESSSPVTEKPTRMPLRSEALRTEPPPPAEDKRLSLRSQRKTPAATRPSEVSSPIRMMKAHVRDAPSTSRGSGSTSRSDPPKPVSVKFLEALNREDNQELISNLNLKYDKMHKGWFQIDKEGQPTPRHRNRADRQAAIWKSKKRVRKPKSQENPKYSPVQMLFMKRFEFSTICRWFLETTETKSLVIVKKVNTRLPSETELCFHSSGAAGTSQGIYPSLQAERLKKHLKKFAIASPVKSNPKSQKLIAKALEQELVVVSKGKEKKEKEVATASVKKVCPSTKRESPKTKSGKAQNPASARILRKYSNIREKMQVQHANARRKDKTKVKANLKSLSKGASKPNLKSLKSTPPPVKKQEDTPAKPDKKKAPEKSNEEKSLKSPSKEKAVKAAGGKAVVKEEVKKEVKKELPKRTSQRLGNTPAPEPNVTESSKNKAPDAPPPVAPSASKSKPDKKVEEKKAVETSKTTPKPTPKAAKPQKESAEETKSKSTNNPETSPDSKSPTSPDQVQTRSQSKNDAASVSATPKSVPKKPVRSPKTAPTPVDEPARTRSGTLKLSAKRSQTATLPRNASKKAQELLETPAKRARTK